MINTNPTAPAWITHTDLIQIDGGHYITYPDDLALTKHYAPTSPPPKASTTSSTASPPN